MYIRIEVSGEKSISRGSSRVGENEHRTCDLLKERQWCPLSISWRTHKYPLVTFFEACSDEMIEDDSLVHVLNLCRSFGTMDVSVDISFTLVRFSVIVVAIPIAVGIV